MLISPSVVFILLSYNLCLTFLFEWSRRSIPVSNRIGRALLTGFAVDMFTAWNVRSNACFSVVYVYRAKAKATTFVAQNTAATRSNCQIYCIYCVRYVAYIIRHMLPFNWSTRSHSEVEHKNVLPLLLFFCRSNRPNENDKSPRWYLNMLAGLNESQKPLVSSATRTTLHHLRIIINRFSPRFYWNVGAFQYVPIMN